jgi:hypothetical protein
MRPLHLPVRTRAIALACHRWEALLGGAAFALTTAFAVLAAGWQLGGVVLHVLGLAS